jgi:hypothetical protein
MDCGLSLVRVATPADRVSLIWLKIHPHSGCYRAFLLALDPLVAVEFAVGETRGG